MATISFTVPDAQLPRIVSAMKELYDIPTIPDPEWVHPGGSNPATGPPQVPEFTDGQWAKEAVRRMIIREVNRWERRVSSKAAEKATPKDNALLS